MKSNLHRVWIQLLVAGLASLSFGISIITFPAIPLSSFLWVRAAYMFIKGVSIAIVMLRAKGKETYWDILLWFELASILTGFVAARYSSISIIILGFIVSVNLVLSGIVQIMMAFHFPRQIHRKWWLVGSGVITLLAGAYIYIVPGISVQTILFLIVIDLFALGFFLVSLSVAVRKMAYD